MKGPRSLNSWARTSSSTSLPIGAPLAVPSNSHQGRHPAFELIFISSDRDQTSFDDYFAPMPWLAVPFGDERKNSLSRTFKIHGIPSLVAIGPNGRTVTKEARDLIMAHRADAYPFTEERLKDLEAATEEAAKSWPERLQRTHFMRSMSWFGPGGEDTHALGVTRGVAGCHSTARNVTSICIPSVLSTKNRIKKRMMIMRWRLRRRGMCVMGGLLQSLVWEPWLLCAYIFNLVYIWVVTWQIIFAPLILSKYIVMCNNIKAW